MTAHDVGGGHRAQMRVRTAETNKCNDAEEIVQDVKSCPVLCKTMHLAAKV